MDAVGSNHRFVSGHLVPVSITLLLREISTLCLVKVALQFASHIFPMDSREVFWRAGNRWASLALEGREGMSNCAVWVDRMLLWSGS